MLHAKLKEELEFVRERMRKYYNIKRLERPRLKKGDKVFLSTRNLRTERLSKKLDYRRVGRFKVKEKISETASRLVLPKAMRLQSNTFHISLLEPAPRAVSPDTQVEAEDEEEEYDVEEVLDSRINNKQLEYLVSWLGYPATDNSWEPATNLNCPEKLEEFHRRNPERPEEGNSEEDRRPGQEENQRRDRQKKRRAPRRNLGPTSQAVRRSSQRKKARRD